MGGRVGRKVRGRSLVRDRPAARRAASPCAALSQVRERAALAGAGGDHRAAPRPPLHFFMPLVPFFLAGPFFMGAFLAGGALALGLGPGFLPALAAEAGLAAGDAAAALAGVAFLAGAAFFFAAALLTLGLAPLAAALSSSAPTCLFTSTTDTTLGLGAGGTTFFSSAKVTEGFCGSAGSITLETSWPMAAAAAAARRARGGARGRSNDGTFKLSRGSGRERSPLMLLLLRAGTSTARC
ncbi:MAG: hypothetical protein J3K34DRAFT_445433 [Monoraphidium minutum]|nr:MAG: hypothetical protein J3K34DRAFT_445433 [Monoraphidium minutum]